jgi:hypothetical protein
VTPRNTEYMKYNPPGAQVSDDALAQKYLLYTPPSWQKGKIWVRKAGIHGRIFSYREVSGHLKEKDSFRKSRIYRDGETVVLKVMLRFCPVDI